MKMKNTIIKICKILLVLFAIFVTFVIGAYICSLYSDWKKARADLKFPDNIETGYWVGTLKIEDPIVTRINDGYYILPRETLRNYDGCDSTFLERADVIHAFTHEYYEASKHTDSFRRHESYEVTECIRYYTAYKGLPVYEFYYPPVDFKLALVRKYKWICIDYPDVFDAYYFKDYEMVLCPRFTKKSKRKMEKHQEDIPFENLKYYMFAN